MNASHSVRDGLENWSHDEGLRSNGGDVRELSVVGGILLGVLSVAFCFYFPWTLAYDLGIAVTLLGAVIGLPTGTIYHIQLYRMLRARGALPAHWYWQPIPLNSKLMVWERPHVLPWCYVGGVGFSLMVLGLIVLILALISARFQLS